jgi:hypothetical protein
MFLEVLSISYRRAPRSSPRLKEYSCGGHRTRIVLGITLSVYKPREDNRHDEEGQTQVGLASALLRRGYRGSRKDVACPYDSRTLSQ